MTRGYTITQQSTYNILLIDVLTIIIISRWDPSRYSRGEDKKEEYAFVGWGAGRHTCSGKRLAELIIKLAVISLLTLYPECSLEFEDGTPIDSEKLVPKVAKDAHK